MRAITLPAVGAAVTPPVVKPPVSATGLGASSMIST